MDELVEIGKPMELLAEDYARYQQERSEGARVEDAFHRPHRKLRRNVQSMLARDDVRADQFSRTPSSASPVNPMNCAAVKLAAVTFFTGRKKIAHRTARR